MKYKDLEEKTYYRDRTFEGIRSGKQYAYFEELKVLEKRKEDMDAKRIHIYLSPSGVETSSDVITMKRSQWDMGWDKEDFITRSNMNRRTIIYAFENIRG